MSFILLMIALVAVVVAVLTLVGRSHKGGAADLVDWKPTRSPEVEVQNELDDVRQMLEAQNEIRRRRGVPAIDEGKLREEVEAEEREWLKRGDPFGDGF